VLAAEGVTKAAKEEDNSRDHNERLQHKTPQREVEMRLVKSQRNVMKGSRAKKWGSGLQRCHAGARTD
jgi:hypothetical protein